MTQYWKNTTAALQPACGEEREGGSGRPVSRRPASGRGEADTVMPSQRDAAGPQ